MVKVVKIFLLVIFFSNCGKKTSSFPEVSINSPTSGAVYRQTEFIPLRARLSHENLRRYQVSIVSTQGLGQFLTSEGTANGPDFQLAIDIELDHQNMPGGNYRVRVTAYTDDDQASAEQPITFIRAPLQNEGLAVIFDQGATYDVGFFPFDGPVKFITQQLGQKVKGAIVQEPGVLITAPEEFGAAQVFDVKTGDLLYTIPRQGPSNFPYFTSISGYTNRYVLANYLGFVEVREANGNVVHNLELDNNLIAEFAIRGNDFYFMQIENILDKRREWVLYNRLGTRFGERLTADTAIMAFSVQFDDWWVLYNGVNGAGFDRWRAGTGARTPINATLFGRALDAVQITPTRYLIATTQGVYDLQTQQSGVIPRGELGNAKKIAFDALQNRIAVLDENEIREYRLSNFQLIRTLSLPSGGVFVGYTYKREE